MGYDLLEENDLSALDGSANNFAYFNEIQVAQKPNLTKISHDAVNIVNKKYGCRIDSCGTAKKAVSQIEADIEKLQKRKKSLKVNGKIPTDSFS
jgi:hypothetical protein